MIAITYLFGYLAIILCIALAISRVRRFTSRPIHIRWELYPVPHEGERAAWGGSYLEESGWWHKPRTHSMLGMAKGLAEEMLLLHLTYKHNRDLWMRTYPFHGGIYLCFASFGLTFLGALLGLAGTNDGAFLGFIGTLANICALVGKIAIVIGGCLLIQRRLTNASLRAFSTPEHYFNLIIFVGWALLGIFAYQTVPSYFEANRQFYMTFMTFNFDAAALSNAIPSTGFAVLHVYTFILMILVPATHMAHLFMKYFTWHSIRWDDAPTLDDKKTNDLIASRLGFKPTWSADHIKGDGQKTWADIAMHNPTQEEK